LLVFFFSSRRRHTRSKRDWSSDVCSSDLARAARPRPQAVKHSVAHPRQGWAEFVAASPGRGPIRDTHHRSADGQRGFLSEPPAHLPRKRSVLTLRQIWILEEQPVRFVADQFEDRHGG